MLRTMIATSALALLCATPAHADADALHDALEAYALYQNDVSLLLDVEVDSGRTVDAALARLSRHNSARVSRGWIAYGALTAAQSPRFASSIEARLRREGRANVVRQLRDDVGYARRQQSPQAIQLILSAATADSARAAQAGARYDRFARAAGSVQLTSATRAELRGSTRLTSAMLDRLRVGAVAGRPMNDANAFGGRGFWDSIAGRDAHAPRSHGGREQHVYASVTDHMLTLAGLVVADATNSERSRVSALLDEPLTGQCMRMQQLQLRQCLSVSVDATERAYCLNQHALAGPGGCFANIVR